MMQVRFETNLVSVADQEKWLDAIGRQLDEHFALAWSNVPPMLTSKPVVGAPIIRVVDQVDVKDALGYHTETGGLVVGLVGAQTCLDYGASISGCISHEVLEACKDPSVNVWVDGPSGCSWSFEMCDAVQDGSYEIDGVTVSNFLFPAYFDPENTTGPYDYLGKLEKPFSRTPDGYSIIRAGGPGTERQLGDRPPWKRLQQGRARLRLTKKVR